MKLYLVDSFIDIGLTKWKKFKIEEIHKCYTYFFDCEIFELENNKFYFVAVILLLSMMTSEASVRPTKGWEEKLIRLTSLKVKFRTWDPNTWSGSSSSPTIFSKTTFTSWDPDKTSIEKSC